MNKIIYVYWFNKQKKYLIGTIEKSEDCIFKYGYEIKQAINNGFSLLVGFEDIDKVYHSKKLFITFSCRIPSNKRKDIKEILNKYNMKEYDEFELLARSGAKLPIDNLYFSSYKNIY